MTAMLTLLLVPGFLMVCVVLFLACQALRVVATGIPPRTWHMDADTRFGFGGRLAAALGGSICLVIGLFLFFSVAGLLVLFTGEITHP